MDAKRSGGSISYQNGYEYGKNGGSFWGSGASGMFEAMGIADGQAARAAEAVKPSQSTYGPLASIGSNAPAPKTFLSSYGRESVPRSGDTGIGSILGGLAIIGVVIALAGGRSQSPAPVDSQVQSNRPAAAQPLYMPDFSHVAARIFSYGVVNTTLLNIHACASAGCAVVDQQSRGHVVAVVGNAGNHWLAVICETPNGMLTAYARAQQDNGAVLIAALNR